MLAVELLLENPWRDCYGTGWHGQYVWEGGEGG